MINSGSESEYVFWSFEICLHSKTNLGNSCPLNARSSKTLALVAKLPFFVFFSAEIFLKAYFKKFPEIKDYMSSTIKHCRRSGFVNNIFGRKTHIIGINDKNFNFRNFQERAAINAPIQGSASELMRIAMIRIFNKLNDDTKFKTKLLLQIHDELIFEIPNNELDRIKKLIKTEMTSVKSSEHHTFSIPILVDVNIGDNWGMLH